MVSTLRPVSVADSIHELTVAKEQTSQAQQMVVAALKRVDEVEAIVGRALDGAACDPLLSSIRQVGMHLASAAQGSGRTMRKLDRTIRQLRGLGS